MAEDNPAAQRQTAVTAYFSSKQLLQIGFAERTIIGPINAIISYLASCMVCIAVHKANSSDCLLLTQAVTAVWLCAESMASYRLGGFVARYIVSEYR